MSRARWTSAGVSLAFVLASAAVDAQVDVVRDVPCCEGKGTTGVVWAGTDPKMTMEELASYLAPVLWFSPDEPLLRDIKDRSQINVPTAFPFEEPPTGPVVYYRLRTLLTRDEGNVFQADSANLNASVVDLSLVSGIDMDFFFYYPLEEGLGTHQHDVESCEMKVKVYRQPECSECTYAISVTRVIGKAHGILWYDNTLVTDKDAHFPIHVLVEEGKHATCPDKNGDGYYTPGYDVNRRVTDAWGLRDIISTGTLYTGGFQSWHAKVRHKEDRVYPPLPQDSPVRDQWTTDGVYGDGRAVYSLRPFPTVEVAVAHDPHLERFVNKGFPVWPQMVSDTGTRDLGRWLEEENFVKSLSISARFDNEIGISFVFPLFIVKSVNDPIGGGWLVNRIYFKDDNLRDWAWNVLYTTSASRWIDGYFAAGIETDKDGLGGVERGFMSETGLKFRFSVAHSKLSFMSFLTDFWGFRAGIRYVGYKEFKTIGYAIEIGAGTF